MIAREIEKEGLPVAHITAMSLLSKQIGANRVITGTKISHPCGDPNLPDKSDLDIRLEILRTALDNLQKDVDGPTIFEPNIVYTLG